MHNPRIKSFLSKSQAEFRTYKKTGDSDYLAQAGEKLWNVMSLIIQEIARKKVKNYAELREIMNEMQKNKEMLRIVRTFDRTYDLHKFFYRGWTEDIREEERAYQKSFNELRALGAR